MTTPVTEMGIVHLYVGEKTRCGRWLNQDINVTVAVAEVDCARCLNAYAREVEGDSDNPLRVSAANEIFAQAAALSTRTPEAAQWQPIERQLYT